MADGVEYADALAEAQRRGFAEADPRNDVEGHDAAHKLAILAGLAFRKPSTSALVVRRGIAGISRDDVRAGAERGLRLKLVALARKDGEVIEAGVTPAYVPEDHPFARPRGAENVVRVLGRGCGPLTFSGQGAGGDATASAVVADVFGALAVRADAAPVHDGDEVVPRPLQAPLLVRFGNGNVVTSEPLALDALEAARAAYAGSGEVRSLIPLLSNSL
jgi:homoserine dehydrogenase